MSASQKRPRATQQDPKGESTLQSISCKRCRQRKVKCDGAYPSCTGCVRAEVPCIVADWSTTRDYTRSEVFELEKKLEWLESLASSQRPPSLTNTLRGNDIMQILIPPMHRTQNDSRNQSRTAASHTASFIYHPPHTLPSLTIASMIVKEYFREFHFAHPLLDEQEIIPSLNLLIGNCSATSSLRKQSIFNLNMVLAIGSIRLFRSGLIELHPFGFFTAALEASPPLELPFDSIDDIEAFLLIARFGIYYNIGCSLWELSRLCIRIAIELELHQPRPSPNLLSVDSERCRIVFWECYLLDRFSSSTLGRPFAINDSAIGVPLLECNPSMSGRQISIITAFNHRVRLRQLTSKIHNTIHQRDSSQNQKSPFLQSANKASNVVLIFPQLRNFAKELRIWRDDAPRSDNPSCLFETQEYTEISYQETRLWLFRAIIDKLQPTGSLPPYSLLRPCMQASCSIINTFHKLRENDLVTFTRTYMHLIFVAGLVLVLVINVQLHHYANLEEYSSGVDVERWLADLEDEIHPTMEEALQSLSTAGETLQWFSEQMPDVKTYTQLFETLKQELERIRADTSRSHKQLATDTNHVMITKTAHDAGGSGLRASCSDNLEDAPFQDSTNAVIHRPHDEFQFNNHEWDSTVPGVSMNTLFPNLFQDDALQPGGSLNQVWQSSSWPFSLVTGAEGIDSNISEYIWDMMPLWQDSPSTTMEHHT